MAWRVIRKRLERESAEGSVGNPCARLRTKTLQEGLREIQTTLRCLNESVPEWRLRASGGYGGQPDSAYGDAVRMERAVGYITLELSRRRKPEPFAEDGNERSVIGSAGSRQSNSMDVERGSFVKPILKKNGWSTQDWAIKSEVDFHTADNYLKGKTRPYRSTRKKLADSLGIEVDKLPK